MDFSMNDDTFHFSEQENECPLNTSLLDQLNVSAEENKAHDAAAGDEADAVASESINVVDLVECEQQENFPFIEGTGPSDEVLATLRKCQAYAHFYEMPSVMHCLEQRSDGAGGSKAWTPCWRPVLRTVAVVGRTTLLLGNGNSWSTACLAAALDSEGQCVSPVKRVLVHHELEPHVRRYLALLQEDHALTVLSFPQLKVVSRFSSVARVTSADVNGNGLPSLLVIKSSGERVRWSPLYSDAADAGDSQPPPPAAKLRVAEILQSKLHTASDRLHRLESSCRQREAFVSRHVSALRHVLAGAPGPPLAQTALASASSTGEALCRVVSVRCKVLHGRSLLICAAISNCSSRLLLSDMELVLSLQSQHDERENSADQSDHPYLEYKTHVYKSVMRIAKQKSVAVSANKTINNGADVSGSHVGNDESLSEIAARRASDGGDGPKVRFGTGGGDCKSGTHIEPLSPCLLRPKKQAYVIGVCRMPVFSSARYLNITGLIRFKTKPLAIQDKKPHVLSPSHTAKVTNTCGNARENTDDVGPAIKNDSNAGKRKEFASPEQKYSKEADSPAVRSKERSVSKVEDFVTRRGGVFVKCRYPEYAENPADCYYQVPIKTIALDALKIDAIKVSLTVPPPKAGVSLDSLALIAGSERCRVLLHSSVCGVSIERLLTQLAQHCDVKQVPDVHNVHVLCAADPSASLHLCALSLRQDHERCVSADLYFRDVRQGLLLVHTLKAVLPFDAVISLADSTSLVSLPTQRSLGMLDEEDRVKLLREKMCKVVQFLSKGLRAKFDLRADQQEQTQKRSKFEDCKSHEETPSVAEIYEERRKMFLESGTGFAVDSAIYEEWKSELRNLMGELDEAYLYAHEYER